MTKQFYDEQGYVLVEQINNYAANDPARIAELSEETLHATDSKRMSKYQRKPFAFSYCIAGWAKCIGKNDNCSSVSGNAQAGVSHQQLCSIAG